MNKKEPKNIKYVDILASIDKSKKVSKKSQDIINKYKKLSKEASKVIPKTTNVLDTDSSDYFDDELTIEREMKKGKVIKSMLIDDESDSNTDSEDSYESNDDSSIHSVELDETSNKIQNKGVKKTVNMIEDSDDEYENPKSNSKTKAKSSKVPDADDLITAQEVKKKMENFKIVKMADVKNLTLGRRIQYFQAVKQADGTTKYVYKPGGILVYIKHPDYVTLSNGLMRWSVQLKKHILFEECIDEIKRKTAEAIREKDKMIEALRNSLLLRTKELEKIKKTTK